MALLLEAVAGPAIPKEQRAALSGKMSGQRGVRLGAQGSPGRLAKREKTYAGRAERARDAALPFIRKFMRPAVLQQERVADQITRLGGEVDASASTTSVIVAELPNSSIAKAGQLAGVRAVAPAATPIPMSSVVDGSPTWHAAGYSGQIPNPDNAGVDGPDVVVYDSGITTAHKIFRSRQASDCATCAGTGPSQDPAHPAAGPNTRVFSPAGRGITPGTNFSGSDHGNTIAAAIAGTDFSRGSGGGTGIAYGIDKLYDPAAAKSATNWVLGNTYQGEAGVTDLPEIVNYSAGTYEDTVGYNPLWKELDQYVDEFGVTWVVAAGNCGVLDAGFTNCYDGPHRVVTPGNLFNVLTVGGMSSCAGNPSAYCVWQNSSSGPTYDGRKKPDIIATPGGNISGPKTWDVNTNGQLDDYGNTGIGTSYAAPQAAAGAALLASVGVSSPMAQRAILINSASPIQNQTYWTPTSGWGALNLDAAFTQRGRYAQAQVTGQGVNGARFFEVTGATADDRTTLVWNRRQHIVIGTGYVYNSLTNLDLTQISPTDATGATVTSTGGSDAADTVDANLTDSNTDPGTNAPTDNPMPGSGQDAEDNVEQVRSTGAGTQLLKVKAMSAVDGQAAEPFAIASKNPITALQTPIPNVTITPDATPVLVDTNITLNITVVNPSNSLALAGATANLDTLPAGVTAVGPTSAPLGTIAPGSSAMTTLTIKGTSGGLKGVSVSASGTAYGEPFAGSDSANIAIDAQPPAVSIDPLPAYSASAAPQATWSADDDFSGIASFDAEQQVAGGGWVRVVDDENVTSLALAGPEGALLQLRVRARDSLGNESGWTEVQTTIDAVPPEISFGPSSSPNRGSVAVPVTVTNAGSLASSTYTFDICGCVFPQPLTPTVIFTHGTTTSLSPKLTVKATDELGREVIKTQTYSVSPRYTKPAIKTSPIKLSRRSATIAGTIAKGAKGRIAIEVRRTSKAGSRRVKKSVRISSGRFKTSIRLKRGKYKVTVSFAGDGTVLAGKSSRTFQVR